MQPRAKTSAKVRETPPRRFKFPQSLSRSLEGRKETNAHGASTPSLRGTCGRSVCPRPWRFASAAASLLHPAPSLAHFLRVSLQRALSRKDATSVHREDRTAQPRYSASARSFADVFRSRCGLHVRSMRATYVGILPLLGQHFSGKISGIFPRTSKINCPLSAGRRQISFLPQQVRTDFQTLLSRRIDLRRFLFLLLCVCENWRAADWKGKYREFYAGVFIPEKLGVCLRYLLFGESKRARNIISRERRFMYNYAFIYTTNSSIENIFVSFPFRRINVTRSALICRACIAQTLHRVFEFSLTYLLHVLRRSNIPSDCKIPRRKRHGI